MTDSGSRTSTPLRSSRTSTPPTSTSTGTTPRPSSRPTSASSTSTSTTATPTSTSTSTSTSGVKKPHKPSAPATATPSPLKPSIKKPLTTGVVGTSAGTTTAVTPTAAKPRARPPSTATSTTPKSATAVKSATKTTTKPSTPTSTSTTTSISILSISTTTVTKAIPKKLSITTTKKEKDEEDDEDEKKRADSSDSEDDDEVKAPLSPSKMTANDILGRSPAHQFAIDNKYLSEADLDALPEESLDQKTAPSKQRRRASSTTESSSFDLKWDPVYKARTTHTLQGAAGDFDPLEIFSLTYSPDGKYLAAGCSDGAIRILNSSGRVSYMLRVPTVEALPTTTLTFRPLHSSAKTKNVLVAGNADGSVSHWHMISQTCLYSITEEDNQIYSIAYNHDGEKFVTAGRDTKVRLYEEATKSLIATLHSGQTRDTTGHSNRVYATHWHPTDHNIVLTGGWDNTIQIWDIRIGMSVRSIYGPHLCGEALDITSTGDAILTGSWIPEKALQQWDYGTGKLISTIDWNGGRLPSNASAPPEMLYSASYSPNRSEWLAAAGSGTNDLRIFNTRTSALIDVIDMGCAAYTHAFSRDGTRMAVAGGSNRIIQVEFRQ